MEKNLLIAFALMGVVIFGTQYFMPQAAPAPVKKEAAQTTPTAAPAAIAKAPEQATTIAPQAGGAAVSGTKEQVTIIETNLYRVEFSNKGGVVNSWILKQYKDSSGKPLDLVHGPSIAKAGSPFSIQLNGRDMNPNLNWYLFAASPAADGLGIDFNYSNGNNRAHKSFRFDRNKYVVDVQSELVLNGIPSL